MPFFRERRMKWFLRRMQLKAGSTILDVGGLPGLRSVPGFWQNHTSTYQVTLMNLPGTFANFSERELAPFRLIEADACEYPCLPHTFDVVFSNAVLEHVGSARRQEKFANFVRSAGASYWIQTPSPWFPIEAHCDIPFWWQRPSRKRRRQINEWKRQGHFLAQQMSSTRPIYPTHLRRLFPESNILTEQIAGLPKSHVAYSIGRPSERT